MNHRNFASPCGALAGTANCIAKVTLECAGMSPGEQFSWYDAEATVGTAVEVGVLIASLYDGQGSRLTALSVVFFSVTE